MLNLQKKEKKMEKMEKFQALGLTETTLKALRKKGFEEPTPIQEKCIPLLLKDDMDVVGQAQTGTGKTAAFGLPILEKVDPHLKKVQALILTPTRELAVQVAEEINSLKGSRRIDIAAIYGGQSIELQIKKLRRGVHIVVGTPGRIIDHINRRTLVLDNLLYSILDEADEMLNMGFIGDIERILEFTPTEKRMLLFSATMPRPILRLAERYMSNYEYVKIKSEALTVDQTDQIYFEVMESDRLEALSRIIDVEPDFYGLVFCRTKVDTDAVASKLIDRGYDAEALHGDISQYQREKILQKFKNKRINILVATDVAARGIDINDLTHVINYSLPQDPEKYVHRIGRTGRAGKEGTAITFITPSEYRKLVYIKRIANTDIRKEKLPGVQEIIEVKKDGIKSKIKEIIDNEGYEKFNELAEELVQDEEPMAVIAALLKYSFRDELDEENYRQLRKVSVDRKGKTRLFVAKGSNSGMTKPKMADYITDKTGVRGHLIDDIRIFDNFSFITVPYEESQVILEIFKNERHGHRPLVVEAKPRQGGNGKGHSRKQRW